MEVQVHGLMAGRPLSRSSLGQPAIPPASFHEDDDPGDETIVGLVPEALRSQDPHHHSQSSPGPNETPPRTATAIQLPRIMEPGEAEKALDTHRSLDHRPELYELDLEGETVDNRFEVLRLLAEGGMAQVYLARQLSVDRLIALKVFRCEAHRGLQGARRFEHEARAAGRLSSSYTVSVHDYGKMANGMLFIAMEYVDGQPLSRLIRTEGPFEVRRAVTLASQLLESLAEAHAHEVVHRDIKPHNILVKRTATGREIAKITDFGIARYHSDELDRELAEAGILVGTPQYVSPEQVRNEPVDGRADIYSLAIVLYEMLSGKPPFNAPTPARTLVQHLEDTPRSLAMVRPHPDLTPELVRVVHWALAKEPQHRPGSATVFRQALLDALEGRSTVAPASLFEDRTVMLSEAEVSGVAALGASQMPEMPERYGQPAAPATDNWHEDQTRIFQVTDDLRSGVAPGAEALGATPPRTAHPDAFYDTPNRSPSTSVHPITGSPPTAATPGPSSPVTTSVPSHGIDWEPPKASMWPWVALVAFFAIVGGLGWHFLGPLFAAKSSSEAPSGQSAPAQTGTGEAKSPQPPAQIPALPEVKGEPEHPERRTSPPAESPSQPSSAGPGESPAQAPPPIAPEQPAINTPPTVPIVVQPAPSDPLWRAIRVETEPAGAFVLEGETVLGRTPLTVQLTGDPRSLTLRLRAHRDGSIQLDADSPSELMVPLQSR